MDNRTNIKGIKLSAAAYYFKINNGCTVDASTWEQIQKDVKKNIKKSANNFFATAWENEQVLGHIVNYGLCVFRYPETTPSYASGIDDYWTERKLGYLIVAKYNQHVAIQCRNISAPGYLLGKLTPIDYPTLTALNNNSSYSKISMKNLDGGANAMRARTYIADDLSKSMPVLGANHYMLSAFNGKNGNGKTFAVTTSTGRIAERAQNLEIKKYCEWVKDTITNITNVNLQTPTDFLSVFAEYVDYKTEKQAGRLILTSFIISTWDIYDKLENAQCTITFNLRGNNTPITLGDLMTRLEKCTNEPILLSRSGNDYVDKKKRISIKLRNEDIIIIGNRLKQVQIYSQQEPEYNGSLEKLINKYGLFNVYFDNVDVIYTQGGLFKNHNLLSNYEQLLGVLHPMNGLNNNTIEKINHGNGNSFQGINSWDNNSMFQIVENTFMNQYDYLICDDMDDEWADHIGISKNKISFFVEKCNDSKYSASAFQEVVGQALKNIGNITPLDAAIDKKKTKWDGVHTTSTIQRWRNRHAGTSIDDAIRMWKNNRTNPTCEKEMCLVVNFIAIDDYKSDLQNINNLNAQRKATAFQRIWILSSFINACKEAGVTPIIYCQQKF